MILTTAALLSALGVIMFVAGFALERPEVAMFGAIIIIGVGASGMANGFQVKTGEVHVEGDGETTVEHVYEDINAHSDFPVGIVVLLLGAIMLMGSAGAASEADLRDEEQKKPPWERGR